MTGSATARDGIDFDQEWLEPDSWGGFASGTVGLLRTRRYHGLLLVARTPPTERVLLVHGVEAWLETAAGTIPLSSQAYAPDVIHPAGRTLLVEFQRDPWPTWRFLLPDGASVVHEICVSRETRATAVRWSYCAGADSPPGTNNLPLKLCVRPFLSGRDYHGTMREHAGILRAEQIADHRVDWQIGTAPVISALHNGAYDSAPDWYRRFFYQIEHERGLDDNEDLFSPGELSFDLRATAACLWFAAQLPEGTPSTAATAADWDRMAHAERQRRPPVRYPEQRAAEAFLVRREAGYTIIAGYPWFTDWGRDTFIALRGLCLATGDWTTAADILTEWAGTVSEGMLPNRFPDRGGTPEFNAVDASLWFIIAACEFLQRAPVLLKELAQPQLEVAIREIIAGYQRGTRHGIHETAEGFIAAGEAGVQLTWMDAKVGDWVVTPRAGLPVEIQALWFNARCLADDLGITVDVFGNTERERFQQRFVSRFWEPARGFLADVVDVDGQAGVVDASLRANQLFAIGGLPYALVSAEIAAICLQRIEAELWTPVGLRTLSPRDPHYHGRYRGGVVERDGAYHQGTVWVWLLGPFVTAWLKSQGVTAANRALARERFLAPLEGLLKTGPLPGHLPEVCDGDLPHTAGGCPAQAWSLGEFLRLKYDVLAEQD